MSVRESGRIKSFAELYDQEVVTGDELVTTMVDYAEGYHIVGEVVEGLLKRAEGLTETHLEWLHAAAVRGITIHAKNYSGSSSDSVKREQGHYAHVAGVVGIMLEQISE